MSAATYELGSSLRQAAAGRRAPWWYRPCRSWRSRCGGGARRRAPGGRGQGLSLGVAAAMELPAGALEVSMARPNVIDPDAFRGALRAVLERVGALSGGDVSLVLPDAAVRLALVPSEGLRGRAATRTRPPLRLHRALPFDVRGARLSWAPPGGEQALVAVAPDEVVAGYEDALEALG